MSSYSNAKTRIKCHCKTCGYEWNTSAASLLQGCGCPFCAGNLKKTHNQFVEEVEGILPNVVIIGEYKNAHTKVSCRCKVCGNVWDSKPNNLLHGEGCNRCAQVQRTLKLTKKQDEFIKEIANLTPTIEVLGKYTNAHEKVSCRCKICGHEWKPLAMDLVKGTGCPECCHTSTSFMEQIILLSFRYALGKKKVHSRDRALIGKELDIYIPDKKLAIEPGAWTWHADKKKNDIKKRQLCCEKGVRLISIYDSYPIKDKPFEEDCFIYSQDIAAEKNHPTLRKLINELFTEYEIEYEIDDKLWGIIENQAYIKSRKITTEEFVCKLSTINTKIDVIGSYKKSNVGIDCRCKICNYEWSPAPSHLLEGKGCPKCAGRMRKTQEEFEADLKKRNSSIIVLGKYQNSSTPILVRCLSCGHEWEPRPGNLLSGYGCPECAKRRVSQRNRLSKEQFCEKMKNRGNPNTIVIGEYINSKTKVACKCKICGFEWKATPDMLFRGHGCKKCANVAVGKAVKLRNKR